SSLVRSSMAALHLPLSEGQRRNRRLSTPAAAAAAGLRRKTTASSNPASRCSARRYNVNLDISMIDKELATSGGADPPLTKDRVANEQQCQPEQSESDSAGHQSEAEPNR